MALSVGGTWGVASVAAAIIFAIGTVIIIFFVRRRHRRLILHASGLSRGLSTYHRTHLSVDGTNYAHIPPPRTRLRRSAYLPYGVVSEGWADLSSHESIARPPVAVLLDQQGIEPELAQPTRRRSLRATFSPRSFHVPKTRRQRKIEKAIPTNAGGRSPLSAITEISDPNSRDVSSTLGAVELPTEVTPTTTPPRQVGVPKGNRSISPQWPLHNEKRRSQDFLPQATDYSVNRDSGLMRTNSTGHSIGPSHVCLSHRSISMASSISVAPGDPLPPLPTITTQYPQRSNSKMRSSMASTDTVSSSVLGTTNPSPSHDRTDRTNFTVESPRVELSPSLLREYEPRPDSWGPTAVTIGTPPGTKASRGLRVGATAIGSFRASIGNPVSQITSTSQAPISNVYESYRGLAESPRTTTDTIGWDSGLSGGSGNASRKSMIPPMQAPVVRRCLPTQEERSIARHSMYEQHIGIGKISFNPDVLRDLSGNKIGPLPQLPQPRPASVGTNNPFQLDQSVLSALRDANLNRSPSSQRRCHKRQNCVRISNLPLVDVGRRASALPQMAEEDEGPETPTKRSSNIPGLRLIQDDDEDIICKPPLLEGPQSQSPFRNRPILNPTSRAPRATSSRASTRDSSGSPRPDSDVFSTDHYDPQRAHFFTGRSPDRNWPLSPTPLKSVKVNSTPSAASSRLTEPYDRESPVLPPPALLSAVLFPRKSALHGPRNLPSSPASGRSSRTASPSPLHRTRRNMASNITATKQRSGDDLRRSVMMLRRLNSDLHNGSPERVSKIYRHIAQEYGGSLGMVGAPGSPSPVRKDDQLAPLPLVTEKRLASTPSSGRSAAVRHSASRLGIGHSTSMKSTTGASIWEDASVRGDSPEPGLPTPENDDDMTPKAMTVVGWDLEACENFVGQERKDRTRESRLTSPHGKGLGWVGIDAKVWGTPASLYDRDGFLKE